MLHEFLLIFSIFDKEQVFFYQILNKLKKYNIFVPLNFE